MLWILSVNCNIDYVGSITDVEKFKESMSDQHYTLQTFSKGCQTNLANRGMRHWTLLEYWLLFPTVQSGNVTLVCDDHYLNQSGSSLQY